MLQVRCLHFGCWLPPGNYHNFNSTQENKTLQTLYINGEIPVAKLRGDDKKCTELNLRKKGYHNQDALVIAVLLAVRALLFFSYPPGKSAVILRVCAHAEEQPGS